MADQQLLQDARRYLAMLHKRRGIVVTCVGVSLAGAFLYNYTSRPLYQATAQILIAESSPKILPNQETFDPLQDYQTEYSLVRSRNLAEKVVERLDLQKSAELLAGPLMSPWERFQRAVLRKPPAADIGSDGIPLSPAAAALRSRLAVEPQPGGRLVNLRINAYDPSWAASVANTWAQLYIEQSLSFRYTTSSEATDWLSERVAEQKARVEQAERALLEYRARQGIGAFNEGDGIVTEKITTLAGALMDARMSRMERETLLGQARSLPPLQLATFPSVMQSGVVQALRAQIAELRAEETRLSESLGPRHPDMLRVASEIQAAEEKLRNEIQAVVAGLLAEYQTARSKEEKIAADLEEAKREALETNRKSLEFSILKREVDTNKDLLESLMSRSKETGLETELKSTNVRIVERAEAPRAPVWPRKSRNYQLALLLGLALGIGLAVLFEHLDNTLKTPEDVKEHLGLPFLGMVPDVSTRSGSTRFPKASPLILKNPQSAVAEAYRVLRTNLIFSSAQESGRLFLVSSAGPGEGKTTTVSNLASSLALNGARVLAVDADLRRPTMHQHFGLQKTPGLTDLIVGKCQASQAIQVTRYKGLQILPCGYVPPNPAELLGADSLKEILAAFKAHYEWVLIDTPPILGMADTPVLCPLMDGVVLVIGAEVASRPAIQRAVDQIASVGGHITGVVLNKVDLDRNAYYYSQYYGEYYRSYYAEGAGRPGSRERPVAQPPNRRT